MNLYFRLLRILFTAWRAPRLADPFQVRELSFRVWPFDIDFNMHLNNARYLSFMDLGRFDLMTRTGLLKIAFQRKWIPVVGHIDIKFIKPIPPFAKIILRTEIHGVGEKYIDIRHTFFYNDHPAAIAHVKGAVIHKGHGRLDPQFVLDELQKISS